MQFKNPQNGYVEDVGPSCIGKALFLGPIYFAIIGAWGWALADLVLLPMIIPHFFVAFAAVGIVERTYLRRGWVKVENRRESYDAIVSRASPQPVPAPVAQSDTVVIPREVYEKLVADATRWRDAAAAKG